MNKLDRNLVIVLTLAAAITLPLQDVQAESARHVVHVQLDDKPITPATELILSRIWRQGIFERHITPELGLVYPQRCQRSLTTARNSLPF